MEGKQLEKYRSFPFVIYPYSVVSKCKLNLYGIASNQPDCRLISDKLLLDGLHPTDKFVLTYQPTCCVKAVNFEASPWDVAGLFGADKVIDRLNAKGGFKSILGRDEFFTHARNLEWDVSRIKALSKFLAYDAEDVNKCKARGIPLDFPFFKELVSVTAELNPMIFTNAQPNAHIPPLSLRGRGDFETVRQEQCENWVTLQKCFGSELLGKSLLWLKRFDAFVWADLHKLAAIALDAGVDPKKIQKPHPLHVALGPNGINLGASLLDAFDQVRELRMAQTNLPKPLDPDDVEFDVDLG